MNFALAHSSCGKIFRSLRSEVQQPSGCLFNLPVPELTRGAGIQLNERVSLRREAEILSSPKSCRISRRRTFWPFLAIGGRCSLIGGSGSALCEPDQRKASKA